MRADVRHEFGALRAGLEAALSEPGAASPEVLGALRRLTRAVRATALRSGSLELIEPGERVPFRDAEHDALAVRDDAAELLAALQARLAATDDRVLVVSEDVILAELLSRPGRAVRLVGERADARRALADGDVAAVVIDLDLPAHDGRELLVELHALDGPQAPATLVLSSRGDRLTRMECTALGAAFVRKPYPPGLVEATLEAALLRGRLDRC